MLSDVISYLVLASVFIVAGLRIFFEKPNKLTELPFLHSEPKQFDKNFESDSVDA